MTAAAASQAGPPAGSWAPLGRRDQLLVRGADAVGFVENFTTARVGDLASGSGCDGFFCDARGWVLALGLIRRVADGLLLGLESGRGATLRRHLDRYHIRERLELVDQSGEASTFLIAGPQAASWLQQRFDQPLPTSRYRFVGGQLVDAAAPGEPVAARLTRADWFGNDGFLLETPRAEAVEAVLSSSGLDRYADEQVAGLRLLRGWPTADDIPDKTLPQELGLDQRAICFTKGCYLGQETVARLDALGHVNRRLTVLAVAGDEPLAPGEAVTTGADQVAVVTSAAPAPSGDGRLALAIVPLKALTAAESLRVAGRPARPLPQPTAAPPEDR